MEALGEADLATKTVGPVVIAVTINTFFYGLCFLQFVKYFQSGTQDSLLMRLFVYWEFFLDTFQTAVSFIMLWQYGVDNFKNEAYLTSAPWTLSITGGVSAFSACPIQTYLSYRVKKLSASRVAFTVLLAAIIVEGGLLLFITTKAFRQTSLSELTGMTTLAKWWTILEAMTNVAISACLIFYLRKKTVGIHRTDHLISRLVRQAVETASLAAFFSIMLLISYIQWPNTLIADIFALPLGRVYTNTCLAVINSRPTLRRELHRNRAYPMESLSSRGARYTVGSISELTRLTTETYDDYAYEGEGDDLEEI